METSTKPVLVMMVGLPASGKSTIAYNLAKENNYIVFSSDALREELYLDINDQTHNHELFVELHKRIKTALKEGNNVIYDACNLSSKRRVAFLQELNRIHCRKECIIAATPYEQCLRNNASRDRHDQIMSLSVCIKALTRHIITKALTVLALSIGKVALR